MDPFEVPIDDDDSSEEEDTDLVPTRDKMFAEWTKIKRQREKFTCEFRNAVVHINGKDFVIKQVSAEITY